ncbi:polyprenol monophosphomannose synthase [bacterium]|nr:polyprenol monophosphomannose synthase [bacterium]
MKYILIVMPTYNEKDNIERIVPAVLAQDERIDMLIIDDGSPDGTGEIADRIAQNNPRVKVLHRNGKLGLGTAYVHGFKYSLEHNYDLTFEMDADFSHDPAYLPKIIASAENGYDLIIGSRWVDGGGIENWPKGRERLSRWASLYSRIITGLPIQDNTAGFQAFRRRIFQELDLDGIHSDGYSFQIETKFRVWRKGFWINEVPIIFKDREMGESKINRKIIYEAFFMVWILRIEALLGRI